MDSFDADVERWRAGPHVKPLLVAVADFDPAEYCADDGPEEGVAYPPLDFRL